MPGNRLDESSAEINLLDKSQKQIDLRDSEEISKRERLLCTNLKRYLAELYEDRGEVSSADDYA